MPITSPEPGTPPGRPAVGRREVLGALGAAGIALVAGCTSAPAGHPRPSPTPTGPDPQLADLESERVLLASYDAVLRAHPTLSGRLHPIRADHVAHVAALRRLVAPESGHHRTSPGSGTPASGTPASGTPASGTPASGTSASTRAPTSPAPTPPRIPADPVAALGLLRTAERSASAARTRSCLAAVTDRAALLGSIAASEASHGVLLDSSGSPSS